MSAENNKKPPLELRGHHLFSLSRAEKWQAHKTELREGLFRRLKAIGFKFLRRDNPRESADHMVDTMLKILREEIDEVQITSQHDAVCDGCPEKGKDKCKVAGIEWSPELLQDFDEAVIRNTDGLLELGKSYDPKFLIDNIDIIRKAIKRTVLEIPELLKK